jgi:hypothetical protein
MTQGILLFAHDNEQIQYSLLAAWQARRIHKWLHKPVSIVTDSNSLGTLKHYNLDDVFDHIILSDAETTQQKIYSPGTSLTFKNVNRTDAYQLSPYDETLVIDTDIVIQSDRLNLVWNNIEDYLVCQNCKDILGRHWKALEYVNRTGIKFYWATLFYFRKSDQSKEFFDRCNLIKENYEYYTKKEYYIPDTYIRNDHVWSMAVHELGATTMPFTLWFGTNTDPITAMTQDTVVVNGSKIARQDVHVMDKFGLMKFVLKELDCE